MIYWAAWEAWEAWAAAWEAWEEGSSEGGAGNKGKHRLCMEHISTRMSAWHDSLKSISRLSVLHISTRSTQQDQYSISSRGSRCDRDLRTGLMPTVFVMTEHAMSSRPASCCAEEAAAAGAAAAGSPAAWGCTTRRRT